MRSHSPERNVVARSRLLVAVAAALVAGTLLAPGSAGASTTRTISLKPISSASSISIATSSSATGTAGALESLLGAQSSGGTKTVETVVVVLSPFLTWNDVATVQPTYIQRYVGERGAVGNMNAITGDVGWPSVAGGALTLSASRWTAGPVGASADPRHLAAIRAANAGSLNPPDIGALGSAIHAAGRTTAAVGNSDESMATSGGVRRPAALLAMDRSGKVDIELTSEGLLASDPTAPFGVRASPKQIRTAIRIALADNPALLVIDPGDLERAHDAPNQNAQQAAASHAAAVSALNEVIFDLTGTLDPQKTLLMVVTPATDKPYYQPPYFGPILVAGLDLGGELTSSSTHRPGLLTNLDVGPTVLSALGIAADANMVGQPMTTPEGLHATLGLKQQSPTIAQSIEQLDTLGNAVGQVDHLRDLYFISFFSWACTLVAISALVVALVPALSGAGGAVRGLILLALAVPGGAWLMFAAVRYPASAGQAATSFVATTLLVVALVVGITSVLKSRAEMPLLALSTLTSLLILADQWTGRPLETGLFSYSIRAGWRYYGMGNEGAALLVGASIAAVGMACDLYADTRWGRALRLWLMPVVAVVALLTAAAPFAGANAGVALWGVVAYGVAWLRVNRIAITGRRIAAILATMVALVVALAAIDMLRGSAETHIGRFFGEALRGDFSAVGDLIARKAANNIGYITQTPYTWLALATAASLAGVRWLGARPLISAMRERPGMSGALLGVVVGGVAAALTEDSGIVMPALMLFAGGLPALYLCLVTSSEKALDPDVT